MDRTASAELRPQIVCQVTVAGAGEGLLFDGEGP